MATVLIVAYLLIVIAMITVILLQRSEGGGLGMGGGGGGGLVSARGSANLLTRTTAILGALFMLTAIGLTILNELNNPASSVLDQAVQSEGAPSNVLDALDSMSGGSDEPNLALPAGQENASDDAPAPQGAAQDGEGAQAPSEGGADLALPTTPSDSSQTPAAEPSAPTAAPEGGSSDAESQSSAGPETAADAEEPAPEPAQGGGN